MPARIDCHLHIWSDGEGKYPYYRERGGSAGFNIPPEPYPSGATTGSAEQLLAAQKEVNVVGAMIVQPVHHGFDHNYITQKMKEFPQHFKVGLAAMPCNCGCRIAAAASPHQDGTQRAQVCPNRRTAGARARW